MQSYSGSSGTGLSSTAAPAGVAQHALQGSKMISLVTHVTLVICSLRTFWHQSMKTSAPLGSLLKAVSM